ncbi:MAG: FxsA family protein [Acidimicrobiales bacterium]|nr:FxsA family protein [Acidimicrobiales bacterium]MCB1016261.1 FxsA family protein [Acidimicrobiales bacterium]MCB9371836.1 FxsA family protein [Microthrixaceae bacterium]
MLLLLTLLFLVVPIVELWVIVAAAQTFGVAETLVVLVLISFAGAYLVKWAGVGVFVRLQKTVRRGEVPTREVVDGFLVLLAGALLLTPGFVTDVLALGLLFPPTRSFARRLVLRRYRDRLQAFGIHEGATVHDTFFAYRDRRADVVDVDEVDDDRFGDDGFGGRSTRPPATDPLFELGP